MRHRQWHAVAALLAVTAACAGSSQSATGQTPGAPPPRASAPQAAASGTCATPDDSTGTTIAATFRSRPEPLYAAGAAALRELGYAVLENMPPREMVTAPSHSWPAGTASEPWHGKDHPGVEVFLSTRTAGDSTTVTIGARALCRVAGASGGAPDSEVGTNLESVITLKAMSALIDRLRRSPRQ